MFDPKLGFILETDSEIGKQINDETIFRCTTPFNDTIHHVDVRIIKRVAKTRTTSVSITKANKSDLAEVKFHVGVPSRRFNRQEIYCISKSYDYIVDMEVSSNCKNLFECQLGSQCIESSDMNVS